MAAVVASTSEACINETNVQSYEKLQQFGNSKDGFQTGLNILETKPAAGKAARIQPQNFPPRSEFFG